MANFYYQPIFELGPDEGDQRLDRWLKKRFPQLTQGAVEKMCRTGQLRIDGGRVKANVRIEAGQEVRVPPVPSAAATPKPAAERIPDADRDMIQQAVLWKDQHIIALNKPPGLPSQGGSGQGNRHVDGLTDALLFGYKDRPKLVHRLDKDTSGILLIARSTKAARWLTAAFREKTTRKIYWALVLGEVKPRVARIDIPISKLPGKAGEKMAVDYEAGQKSLTDYEVVEQLGKRVAWVALSPITGRTHQLRVHMMERRAPILGDGKYGGPEAFLVAEGLSRKLHLHAREVEVQRPNGTVLKVTAPLPDHMLKAWDFFGFDPKGGADALREDV